RRRSPAVRRSRKRQRARRRAPTPRPTTPRAPTSEGTSSRCSPGGRSRRRSRAETRQVPGSPAAVERPRGFLLLREGERQRRRRHLRERRLERLVLRDIAGEDETMAEHERRDILDVFGGYRVAAVEARVRLRRAGQV